MIIDKAGKESINKEKASILSKIGGGLGTAFKSVFNFLNAPRGVSSHLAGGVITGVGFTAGKKIGKGLFAFLRSFFPYDLYDFFILAMIFQHIIIDGILFGYSYSPQVYTLHFWIAVFFVIVFSIYREEGEGFLTSLVKNAILFIGVVFLIESYFFPFIANSLRNPYFIINRIILPIWPIFAIAYASYKRESTTPFVRKIVILFIIFIALISWPYIEKITTSVTIPGSNPVEKIEAKITFNIILERLKEGSYSFWNSFKGSVVEPIIYFINGSWINEQIEPFRPDRGQYEESQRALEIDIKSPMVLPPYVTDEDKVELKISASFEGVTQKEVPKEIIKKSTEYNLFISRVLDTNNNIIPAMCDEPAPVLNALTYQTLSCEIPVGSIPFDKNNQAQLKAQITYDFYTFAYRDFYFMHEKKLYEYIVVNKNPYLEESDFLGGPQTTKNSAGPVLIGLSANGEMEEYPIRISSDKTKHIFVLSLTNAGSGFISNITRITLLIPKEITLEDTCAFKEEDCYDEMDLDSEEVKQRYKCLVKEGDSNLIHKMIKNGNQYLLPCSFTIDPGILAGYKNVLPVYAKVKYQYMIYSPKVNIVKANTGVKS